MARRNKNIAARARAKTKADKAKTAAKEPPASRVSRVRSSSRGGPGR